MFVSGQIGLIPQSMTMPRPSNIMLEMALSLQHAEHVAALTMSTLGTGSSPHRVETAILWMTNTDSISQVRKAWTATTEVSPLCGHSFLLNLASRRMIRLAARLLYLLERRSFHEVRKSKHSCFITPVMSSLRKISTATLFVCSKSVYFRLRKL